MAVVSLCRRNPYRRATGAAGSTPAPALLLGAAVMVAAILTLLAFRGSSSQAGLGDKLDSKLLEVLLGTRKFE